MIPTSQSTFTEERLLALANSEIRSRMLPLITKVREGYYSYDMDYTLNATGIYSIPTRAVGGKFQTIALMNGETRKDLTRFYEQQLTSYVDSPVSLGFFIKRSKIHLLPKVPSGYDTLRVGYILRPPSLVSTSSAAQITAIDTATKTITVGGTMPSAFGTNILFDLVQAEPHFDTLGFSLVVTNVSATQITFDADLPSDLAVGDWVSRSGETPVVQIPVELQPLLAQYVANTCLKGQTDLSAYKAGMEDAAEMRKEVLALINPRVETAGKIISNRTGMLRRGL